MPAACLLRNYLIEEMKKVDEAIYNEEGRKAVQYGTTEGYVPLREEICKRMKDKFFVDCKPEDVVVTTGSQQALFILAQILLDKDQTILMESPSYASAIAALILSARNIRKFRRTIRASFRKNWKRFWLLMTLFA